MRIRPRFAYVAAIFAVAASAGVLGLLAMHGGKAEAQGLLSAPACQCSLPTVISSMSSSVVHCLCGGMSCVVSEHKEQGKNTNLMQCAR